MKIVGFGFGSWELVLVLEESRAKRGESRGFKG